MAVDSGPPTAALPGQVVAVLVVLAVVAIGLAVAVIVEPGPLPGELAIVHSWQARGEPVPTIAEWVRLTTGTEGNLVVAAVPAWLVIRRYHWAGVTAVAIAAFTMLVAQPVLKLLVDRPRPTDDQVDVRAEHTSMSFPSGHSMSTMAVWGVAVLVAAYMNRPLLTALASVPIVLTSQASLIQGVHWPSDSAAGLALGGISAIASTLWLRKAELDRARRYGSDGGGSDGLRHAGRRRSPSSGSS